MLPSTVSVIRRLLPLVALLPVVWMGCSKSQITGPRADALRLAIQFPRSSASAGVPAVPHSPSASLIDAIRVSVFAKGKGGTGQLLLRQQVAVAPGQTEFEIGLSVTSATAFRIQVEASGFRQRSNRSTETTYGLQYLGNANLEPGDLGSRTILIEMRDAVPLLVGRRGLDGNFLVDSLEWEAVPGAVSYTVRDSETLLATGLTGGSYEIVEGSGAEYRVSAAFVGGLESAFSEALSFTAAAPSIIGLTPGSALAGDGQFTLAVTGTNFQPGSVVFWDAGASAPTPLPTRFMSTVAESATVAAALIANEGSVRVQVRNPDGQFSNSPTFLIIASTPSIVTVRPDPVPAGLLAGVTLTVTGANFVSGAVVRWNGIDLATTHQSSTVLAPYVPPALIANEGEASLQVRNPNGLTSKPYLVLIRGF